MANIMPTLLQFAGGYLLVLVTPGPNLLAIGGTAAVRGLRTAFPLCLGITAGACCLCAAAAFAPVATGWDETGGANLVGAALLVFLAISLLRRRTGRTRPAWAEAEGTAAFGAGFLTAGTNPITGSYFLSALMRIDTGWPGRIAIVACVLALSLAVNLALASALAQPGARDFALRHDRPIRMGSATILLLMALRTAVPLFG